MAIVNVAVRKPAADGVKVISNVVEPEVAATGVTGVTVTEKSAALAPVIDTYGLDPVRINIPDPVF